MIFMFLTTDFIQLMSFIMIIIFLVLGFTVINYFFIGSLLLVTVAGFCLTISEARPDTHNMAEEIKAWVIYILIQLSFLAFSLGAAYIAFACRDIYPIMILINFF